MRKRWVFSFILLCILSTVSAQPDAGKRIDSLKTALSRYRFEKKQARRALQKKDTAEVSLLYRIAYEYYTQYSEEAIPYAREGIALGTKLHYLNGVADCANILSVIYANTGRLDDAEKYYRISLDSYKRNGDKEGTITILMNLGSLSALQRSKYDEGLRYTQQGIRLAKSVRDTLGLLGGYNNMGAILQAMGNQDEALVYFRKSLEIQRRNSKYGTICITLQNIGELYAQTNQPQTAMLYFNEAMEKARASANKESMANTLNGISKILEALEKYDEAMEKQRQSLALRLEIDDRYGIANSYLAMGQILYAQHKNREAMGLAEKGYGIAREAGLNDLVLVGSGLLSDLYRESGDYRRAYDYHVVFKATNDSIFGAEKDKKVTEMQLRYEFREQQETERLQQQKKDAEAELKAKKQRYTLYFIILALLLSVAFALWVWANLKKSRKQKRLIEEQKELIQESLAEKETLLREIHHRVKNNLQIISSLLNIQSTSIDDQNVLSSIQEGQSRVQAMSLIHQNLYQSERVNNVRIDNYLQELLQYLSNMFQIEGRTITTEIAAEGIEFDIDTAIPLGLIVNELVSNAYKYAFTGRDQGRIQVLIQHTSDHGYLLTVANDGETLPDGFELKNHSSLGLKLVSILSRQLRGSFSADTPDGRTRFLVVFRDTKTKSS
ncbi:MAG TPA: tetratricopeptide repeat protein [Flavobacterium sp.]|nr:tetratricopeptide repeat protein [Flavobacterium sp.]